MPLPTFSLVLATYGRVDEIGRLMDSLAAQTCADFELIFADQNPDDRVLPFVERAHVAGWQYQHLRLARPNLSAARNAGIQAARGEWLAIPDDDCWYEPETIAQVLARVREASRLDGLVVRWVEQQSRQAALEDSPLNLAAWRCFRGRDASSIGLFLRASAVRRVGGFDERLGVGQWFGSGEETDLVLRLLESGSSIERLPDALVHHVFGPRARGPLATEYRMARGRARGWGGLCAKNRIPAMTVIRGLLGPFAWPFVRGGDLAGLARAAGQLVGRWQGYLAWRLGLPPSAAQRDRAT